MQPLPQCPLVHHLCTFGCNEADTEQAHNFPRSDPILHLKYALQDQEQGKGIQQQLEQTREHKGRTIATTLQQARRQLLQTGTASTAVSCRIVEFRPEAWSAQCICRASPAQQAIKVKIKAWKIFHAWFSPIKKPSCTISAHFFQLFELFSVRTWPITTCTQTVATDKSWVVDIDQLPQMPQRYVCVFFPLRNQYGYVHIDYTGPVPGHQH